MKTLTLVVDERELSTIGAALLLLQEQVDVLPEDIAKMVAAHGMPMEVPEIERLSFRRHETERPRLDYAERELQQATGLVEVEQSPLDGSSTRPHVSSAAGLLASMVIMLLPSIKGVQS
jgi:hypothetical protein